MFAPSHWLFSSCWRSANVMPPFASWVFWVRTVGATCLIRGMSAYSTKSASSISSTHLFINWCCGGFIGRWWTVVQNIASSGIVNSTCASGMGSTSLREHAKTSVNSVSSLVTSSLSFGEVSLPILTLRVM